MDGGTMSGGDEETTCAATGLAGGSSTPGMFTADCGTAAAGVTLEAASSMDGAGVAPGEGEVARRLPDDDAIGVEGSAGGFGPARASGTFFGFLPRFFGCFGLLTLSASFLYAAQSSTRIATSPVSRMMSGRRCSVNLYSSKGRT